MKKYDSMSKYQVISSDRKLVLNKIIKIQAQFFLKHPKNKIESLG